MITLAKDASDGRDIVVYQALYPPYQMFVRSLREFMSDVDRKKYPDAVIADEICTATRIRQEAVMALKNGDLLIVVGDSRSNNSGQLKAIGLSSGIPHALLIDSEEDLKEEDIRGYERIAVTSGSSTPNLLTAGVIRALQRYAETGELVTEKISITQIL